MRRALRLLNRDLPSAVCLYGLLAAAFWLPYILGKKALFYDVLFRLFYPDAEFLRACVRGGAFPFWNPHLYSGVPYMANMQSALFYPATYLYALLPFHLATAWNSCLHTALAGIFMYSLAKKTGLPRPAALFSGLAFCLCGFSVAHYAFPSNIQAYAWLPLILLCLERALKGARARPIGEGALCVGVQLLAGHPQFVLYGAAAGALWALRAPKGSRARAYASWAAMFGLGALVASLQLLPTLLFSFESRRIGLGYDWATTYSLSPREFLKMALVPQWNLFFDPASADPQVICFYFGPIATVLALFAFRGRDTASLRLRRPLAAIALCGLLLAFGRHTPLYRLLYDLILPLRVLRLPGQGLFLTCFAASLLCGVGFARLDASRSAKALLAGACLLDLALFGWRQVKTIDPGFYRAETPNIRFLQERAGLDRVLVSPRTRALEHRAGRSELEAWLKFHDSLYPNLSMAHGLFDAAGNEELRFARYDLVLAEVFASPDSPWLDALSIRYVLSQYEMPSKRFRPAAHASVTVFENPKALPRAYLAASAVDVGPEGESAYLAAHPGHDFRARALMDSSAASERADARPSPTRGTAAIAEYSPNFVRVLAKAGSASWLILTDTYAAGWSARVNGQPAPVLRANWVQRAVRVPAGDSTVVFEYCAPGWTAGCLLSLLGLATAWALLRTSGRTAR